MAEYLVLQHPGHNRVFFSESAPLAVGELTLITQRFAVACSEIAAVDLAGVRYLRFTADAPLTDSDLALLAGYSFAFAIYRRFPDDRLQPIALPVPDFLPRKISTILKYGGKTNELFTRMMIQVGRLAGVFGADERMVLLDPVAGRGTTLYEAATMGLDAFGVEIEHHPIAEAVGYFRKFLEEERWKHTQERQRVSGASRHDAVFMQQFEYARDKSSFKDNQERRMMGFVHGDAGAVDRYFKRNRFHLIVGDLPYGIAHGNATEKGGGTRNPYDLVEAAAPAWKAVLKPGGAVVLAWNVNLISKYKLGSVFEKLGLEVLRDAPFDRFDHRVDRAIRRDVLVVRKKR